MTIEELEDDAKGEREFANKLFTSYQNRREKFLEKLQEFQNKQTKENYEICRDSQNWAISGFHDALASWENATDLEQLLFELSGKITAAPECPKNDLVGPVHPVKWAE